MRTLRHLISRRKESTVAYCSSEASSLKIGDTFSLSRCFTSNDLIKFSALSSDTNPIHTDPASAKAAGFSSCVVHGMLTASLFPAIIGSTFPGAIYVSQTLKFHAPVLLGDQLLVEVTVCESVKHRRHFKVTFSTNCFRGEDASRMIVLNGSAIALLPNAATSST